MSAVAQRTRHGGPQSFTEGTQPTTDIQTPSSPPDAAAQQASRQPALQVKPHTPWWDWQETPMKPGLPGPHAAPEWPAQTEMCSRCKICTRFWRLNIKIAVKYLNDFYIDSMLKFYYLGHSGLNENRFNFSCFFLLEGGYWRTFSYFHSLQSYIPESILVIIMKRSASNIRPARTTSLCYCQVLSRARQETPVLWLPVTHKYLSVFRKGIWKSGLKRV